MVRVGYLKGRGVRLPEVNVDVGEYVAGDGGVEVGVPADQHVGLDHVNSVQVVAQQAGQGHLPQLLQLIWKSEATIMDGFIYLDLILISYQNLCSPLVKADGGMLF